MSAVWDDLYNKTADFVEVVRTLDAVGAPTENLRAGPSGVACRMIPDVDRRWWRDETLIVAAAGELYFNTVDAPDVKVGWRVRIGERSYIIRSIRDVCDEGAVTAALIEEL